MTEFFYDSWLVILEFLIPGIFLGVVYDIFRLSRIARNDKTFHVTEAIKKRFFSQSTARVKQLKIAEPWIVFIEDIVFFLIVAVTEILATYHINNGEIRIYCLLISAIGFFAYQKTLGRTVIFFSTKILYLIRKTVYIITCVILTPPFLILKQIKKLFRAIHLKRKQKLMNSRKDIRT